MADCEVGLIRGVWSRNEMPEETSQVVWAGASWRLIVEEAILPDGSRRPRGKVDHPGSVVMIALHGDEVLMVAQYRPALQLEILELPAGTRGWDEPWLACAQRELREETGYRASRWVSLGRIWAAPGLSNEQIQLYLAWELTPDPLPMDVDEQIVLRPMPLARLEEMALDGRLEDAKSVVGILRAAAYWRHNPPGRDTIAV